MIKHIRLMMTDAPYAFRRLQLQWVDLYIVILGIVASCVLWEAIQQ